MNYHLFDATGFQKQITTGSIKCMCHEFPRENDVKMDHVIIKY